MKKLFIMMAGLFLTAGFAVAETVDFEDLTLEPESYWNGSDNSGGFTSGFAHFNNLYNEEWGTWSGFAYSNRTDTEARGYAFADPEGGGGEFNAIAGGGHGESEIYAVAYMGEATVITLDEERTISGAYFTNTNIAYYSMLEGDDFAKQFEEDDFLRVTVTGFDAEGEVTGDLVFHLAENGEIVNEWTWIDFSVLGPVKSLGFDMTSSDMGDWGMNTPSFFAMDSFNGTAPDEGKSSSSSSSTCFIGAVGGLK